MILGVRAQDGDLEGRGLDSKSPKAPFIADTVGVLDPQVYAVGVCIDPITAPSGADGRGRGLVVVDRRRGEGRDTTQYGLSGRPHVDDVFV